MNPCLNLRKRNGALCLLKSAGDPRRQQRILHRWPQTLPWLMIGRIAETRETLNIWGQHNLVSDIGITTFTRLGEAKDRVVKCPRRRLFSPDPPQNPSSF